MLQIVADAYFPEQDLQGEDDHQEPQDHFPLQKAMTMSSSILPKVTRIAT